MNQTTRNSLIAVFVMSGVYITNFFRPDLALYTMGAALLIVIVGAKYLLGLKLERKLLFANTKFLLFPLIFNISAISYISLIYFDFVRFLLTVLAVGSNYYLFISLRKLRNLGERASILSRNILVSISFLSVFMATSIIFRLYMAVTDPSLFSYALVSLVLSVFGLIYFVTYFLTWEKGILDARDRSYAVLLAFLVSQIAWVASAWSINYPVLGTTEKAALGGSPIAAVIITISYYFLWGVVSHKLERNLTVKVLAEYLLIMVVFFTILLLTAKWIPLS